MLHAKKGFTILYAVLVAGLLLSIGVSIYSISIKQYTLSSSAIDSQVAIYAADAGMECALYWDIGQGTFPDPNGNEVSGSINCNGSVTFDEDDDGTISETTFTVDDPTQSASNNLPCAVVTITKLPSNDWSFIKTKIESRGYNYCGAHPQKVERALRVNYPPDNTEVP